MVASLKALPLSYKEGPWRGQYNGDRRYSVDFSAQIQPMGTYHILDGARCRIIYPGNLPKHALAMAWQGTVRRKGPE